MRGGQARSCLLRTHSVLCFSRCLTAAFCDLHTNPLLCSTCPYANKGLTWQQAVQWVGEVKVQTGQELHLTASHDTYSISYSLGGAAAGGAAAGGAAAGGAAAGGATEAGQVAADPNRNQPQSGHGQPTGVPLVDSAWQAAYERLQGLNSQLVKACVQNPLEYRAVAQAALQFAARPHDLGVDAQQAVEFCVKMMG